MYRWTALRVDSTFIKWTSTLGKNTRQRNYSRVFRDEDENDGRNKSTRWDSQKEERERRLGVYRRAKVARRGSRRYRKPRNFLFQFAINKSTTPLVNRLRLATALSKVRLCRGRRATERRRTKKTPVQLGRIKGIKGRLVTRIFRLPASTLVRGEKGETREKKKGRWKVCSFPALRFCDLGLLSRRLFPPPLSSAPLQRTNVCINRS